MLLIGLDFVIKIFTNIIINIFYEKIDTLGHNIKNVDMLMEKVERHINYIDSMSLDEKLHINADTFGYLRELKGSLFELYENKKEMKNALLELNNKKQEIKQAVMRDNDKSRNYVKKDMEFIER